MTDSKSRDPDTPNRTSEPIELEDGREQYEIQGLSIKQDREYDLEFTIPSKLQNSFAVGEIQFREGELFIDGENLSGCSAVVREY